MNLEQKHTLYNNRSYYIKGGKLYDAETFEFLGHEIDFKLKHKPTEVQKKVFEERRTTKNHLDLHIEKNNKFVWCLFNNVDRFPSLNSKDIARLLYLATYVHYEDGILQKGNGTKLNVKTIHELIKMDKKRAKQYLNKLVDEGIIEILGDYIKMNHHAFYKGELSNIKDLTKDLDLKYIRLFRRTIREIFENAKPNEIAHISTIYNILPFLNLEYNYICYNTNEKDADLIEFMDTKELCKVAKLGSYNKMMDKLRKVTVDGVPVFTFIEDVDNRRRKNIIVNHNVVYAGRNIEHMKALDAIFKPKRKRKSKTNK